MKSPLAFHTCFNGAVFFTLASGQRWSRCVCDQHLLPEFATQRIAQGFVFELVDKSVFLYFSDFISCWDDCSKILPLFWREVRVVSQITIAGSTGNFLPLINRYSCFPKKQKTKPNGRSFDEFRFYWPVLQFCFES